MTEGIQLFGFVGEWRGKKIREAQLGSVKGYAALVDKNRVFYVDYHDLIDYIEISSKVLCRVD